MPSVTATARAFLALAALLLALPAVAGAEYLIPKDNSAVNQYTEGVPTGGGERATNEDGGRGVNPGKTIGRKNAAKLEQAGPEGREAAEVAAETAPPVAFEERSDSAVEPAEERSKRRDSREDAGTTGGGAGSGGGGTGGGAEGSSALGEIAATAAGVDGGGLGLLLLLALVATLGWGIGYRMRADRIDARPVGEQ